MYLVCGADDILGLANPKYTQKQRLFNCLKRLDADIILLDLGAGTSYTSLDFFLYAPNKIVVLTPQITSIQNAYGFIKSGLYRLLVKTFSKDTKCLELINRLVVPDDEGRIDSIARLKEEFTALGNEQQAKLSNCLAELNIGLIVNMVKNRNETGVGRIVQNVANNYLRLYPEYLGHINYDRMLELSINNMVDYLIKCNDNLAGTCFDNITSKILDRNFEEHQVEIVLS